MKPKSETHIDFDDFYDILDHLEIRTGLFLLKKDLDLLYSFISGISMLEMNNKLNLKNIDKFYDFSLFVHQKLELQTKNTSWFGAIRYEFGSDEKGFNKFFEYLNEFRKK